MTAHGLFALLFAPSGQNAGGGMTVFLVQIGALIAIFYFMLIRPQRRQQERHRQLLASLQRGDRIVTSGGIIGEVVHLKDDEVTVKSGESRLIVQRDSPLFTVTSSSFRCTTSPMMPPEVTMRSPRCSDASSCRCRSCCRRCGRISMK